MTLQSDFVSRALSLPIGERAELARQLIMSLETGEYDVDVDAAWETEIERRMSEVDKDQTKVLDWRESIGRIKSTLQKREPE